jgi:hypothetical protein
MRRGSFYPFLPAVLAALTDVWPAGIVIAHQPDYPASVVMYQVVMLGAALLAAVPRASPKLSLSYWEHGGYGCLEWMVVFQLALLSARKSTHLLFNTDQNTVILDQIYSSFK